MSAFFPFGLPMDQPWRNVAQNRFRGGKSQERKKLSRKDLRDAYRAFNRASMEAARHQRLMEAADELLARIAARNREALVREYTDSLQDDSAFCRVLSGYTGHTPHGWSCACGCDGRMRKLLKNPGWDILSEVIRRIRWRKFSPKGKLSSGVVSDAVCRIIDAENGR